LFQTPKKIREEQLHSFDDDDDDDHRITMTSPASSLLSRPSIAMTPTRRKSRRNVTTPLRTPTPRKAKSVAKDKIYRQELSERLHQKDWNLNMAIMVPRIPVLSSRNSDNYVGMSMNNIASPVGTPVKPMPLTSTMAVVDDDVSNLGQDSENQAPVATLFSPSPNIRGDKLLSPYSTNKNKNENKKMEFSTPAKETKTRQATFSSNDDDNGVESNCHAGQDTGHQAPVEMLFSSPSTASRTTLGDTILSPSYSASKNKNEMEFSTPGTEISNDKTRQATKLNMKQYTPVGQGGVTAGSEKLLTPPTAWKRTIGRVMLQLQRDELKKAQAFWKNEMTFVLEIVDDKFLGGTLREEFALEMAQADWKMEMSKVLEIVDDKFFGEYLREEFALDMDLHDTPVGAAAADKTHCVNKSLGDDDDKDDNDDDTMAIPAYWYSPTLDLSIQQDSSV
jgi:hypothetical protein